MTTPDDLAEEDAGWAEVVRRWDDDEAHRAFLARRTDLDGLADAGRRYKAALDARPGDAVAARWRDEVLRRATALAFAQLPRRAPAAGSKALRRGLAVAVFVVLVAIVAWAVLRLPAPRGAP